MPRGLRSAKKLLPAVVVVAAAVVVVADAALVAGAAGEPVAVAVAAAAAGSRGVSPGAVATPARRVTSLTPSTKARDGGRALRDPALFPGCNVVLSSGRRILAGE